jgi:hypothetical protein
MTHSGKRMENKISQPLALSPGNTIGFASVPSVDSAPCGKFSIVSMIPECLASTCPYTLKIAFST